MPDLLTYRGEVHRKLIHISSSTIAILLWYFGKDVFLPWILATAIIFLILDYLRRYIPFLKQLYFRLFGMITRPDEYEILSGASWVFLGAGFTVYLFDENIAIVAILVMSLSDSAAAIIGIKYGATFLFNKSLEGTLAFLITTFVIIRILSPASLILTLIVTISATIIELVSPSKLNDNILIPVSTGLILTLGGAY